MRLPPTAGSCSRKRRVSSKDKKIFRPRPAARDESGSDKAARFVAAKHGANVRPPVAAFVFARDPVDRVLARKTGARRRAHFFVHRNFARDRKAKRLACWKISACSRFSYARVFYCRGLAPAAW